MRLLDVQVVVSCWAVLVSCWEVSLAYSLFIPCTPTVFCYATRIVSYQPRIPYLVLNTSCYLYHSISSFHITSDCHLPPPTYRLRNRSATRAQLWLGNVAQEDAGCRGRSQNHLSECYGTLRWLGCSGTSYHGQADTRWEALHCQRREEMDHQWYDGFERTSRRLTLGSHLCGLLYGGGAHRRRWNGWIVVVAAGEEHAGNRLSYHEDAGRLGKWNDVRPIGNEYGSLIQ